MRENMKYLSAVRKIEVGSQVRELGDYCSAAFSGWKALRWEMPSNGEMVL